MNKVLFTIFTGAFCSLTFSAFAQQTAKQAQKWEYKIVNNCREEDRIISIHQLGEEGWELVSTDPAISGEASSCSIRYFKRPKGNSPKQPTKPEQQPPPRCTAPLDKAPTVRGLRLGMSGDEVLREYPDKSNKYIVEEALKKAGSALHYGLVGFGIFNLHQSETYAGIGGMTFKVFDGRVVEIGAEYDVNRKDLNPSWTIEEWVAKISETFGLPGIDAWQTTQGRNQRRLACGGFVVEAKITNSYPYPNPELGLYHASQLVITDPSYRSVVEQRLKEDHRKIRRAFKF